MLLWLQYPVTQVNDTAKSSSAPHTVQTSQVHATPLRDEVCVAYLGQLSAASWSIIPAAQQGSGTALLDIWGRVLSASASALAL